MIFTNKKPLTAKNCMVGCVLFWTVVCLLITGCAKFSGVGEATKEYISSFSSSDSHLKKKVGIIRFENRTHLKGIEVEDIFLNRMLEIMHKECDEILLLNPGETGYPDGLIDLPKQPSGEIDNLYLAETGRQLGLNALITGALINVSDDREKHGMLWFKSTRIYVRVQIEAAVYDSETGAKLFDDTFSHRIELEDLDVDFLEEYEFKIAELDSKTIDTILTEAFDEISSEMGEAICEALEEHPWRGFVTSINDDKIVISAGKTAGLEPGDILEVYSTDDIYQGAQNQRFFIPGHKTGEIKIIIVDKNVSIAEVVSGENIKIGSSVRPKK